MNPFVRRAACAALLLAFGSAPAALGAPARPAAPAASPCAVVELAGGAGRYRVRLEPSRRDADVVVARVESGLVSQVARGENGGRVLRHSSVVRAFKVVAPGPDGTVTVALGRSTGGAGSAV